MYGKVMSISDAMMWRYYELLTDVKAEQIAAMKADAANGKAHPMALKKELARGIVADFHSSEAAVKAEEDWARQFQKNLEPSDIETVSVELAKVNATGKRELVDTSSYFAIDDPTQPHIKLVWFDKILTETGMVASRTEGARKIDAGAVYVDGKKVLRTLVTILPASEKVVRLGKRVKKVVINE
jgi:tyrosyl-tRNA synthetase